MSMNCRSRFGKKYIATKGRTSAKMKKARSSHLPRSGRRSATVADRGFVEEPDHVRLKTKRLSRSRPTNTTTIVVIQADQRIFSERPPGAMSVRKPMKKKLRTPARKAAIAASRTAWANLFSS